MNKQKNEVPAESKPKNPQNKGKLSYIFPSVLVAAIAINGCSATFRPSSIPTNIPLAEQIAQVDETAQTPEERAQTDPSIFASKVYVGESISEKEYVAKLETLSVPSEGAASKASIQISDPNGTIISAAVLAIGDIKEIKVGGETVFVSVYNVNPGLTPLDSWVDMDITVKSEGDTDIKFE